MDIYASESSTARRLRMNIMCKNICLHESLYPNAFGKTVVTLFGQLNFFGKFSTISDDDLMAVFSRFW